MKRVAIRSKHNSIRWDMRIPSRPLSWLPEVFELFLLMLPAKLHRGVVVWTYVSIPIVGHADYSRRCIKILLAA